jgi:branched-chain amino acid transport system permease protein
MYALVALGYTMVYGIINLINFAHGEVLMVGAYSSWMVVMALQGSGLPGWLLLLLSLIAAIVICSALNFSIEKIAYRPLRNAPRLAPLITAMGMSLLLQTLAMIIWKPNYKSYPILLPSEPYNVGGAVINNVQIMILVVTALAGMGLPGWLMLLISLICAIVVCCVLNYSIEKIAYRPLRNAPRLAPLITAMGMSLLLQTLAMIIWKPNVKPYPLLLSGDPIFIGGAVINTTQILILAVTAIALIGLMYLVNRTKLGRAMRATAENPRVAGLMGVRPDAVISATFIIGAALAALAGVMYAANYGSVQHTMGFLPGLKAFTAAVFGGIGNLAGAMVGGVLLGLIESLGAGYIGQLTGGVLGSNFQDIFAFIVLILVLTLRPQGLLGERVADRA